MKKAFCLLVSVLAFWVVISCSGDDNGGSDSGNVSAYAGQWNGTYSGGDSGTFSVTISNSGGVSGIGYSAIHNVNFVLNGAVNSDGSFNAGDVSTGAAFNGMIEEDAVSGNWTNANLGISGTFVGQRE